jgi:hypothetical protein
MAAAAVAEKSASYGLFERAQTVDVPSEKPLLTRSGSLLFRS